MKPEWMPAACRCALAAFVLAAAAPAQAEEALATFNQSALARSFALPTLGAPQVLGGADWRSAFRVDLTSEYHSSESGSEAILLDGEAASFTFAFRQGLGRGFEWGAELPVLVLGGGFMDSGIENWHDWFGLPNGGRQDAPRDRYRYTYVRNGETLLDVSDAGAFLGDLRLNGGWQATPSLALRAQIKLPTGDEDSLAGGNLGGALWADWALPFAETSRWSGYVSAGASQNQESDVLGALQNRFVGFGGLGISWQMFDAMALTTQLYAHSQLYDDSDLQPLERAGLQLTVATRWNLTDELLFDFGFQEDLITYSSPDFSLYLGFGFHPAE